MLANNIAEGLQIIERSRPESKSPYHVRAEHDKVYAGSLAWGMSEVDQRRLEELGWDKDEDADGWVAFV